VLRAEDLAKPLLGDLEDRSEVGRPMVDDGLGERLQHLGRHGRRAGREELLRPAAHVVSLPRRSGRPTPEVSRTP
jgi:hypothetical protein